MNTCTCLLGFESYEEASRELGSDKLQPRGNTIKEIQSLKKTKLD